MATVITDPDLLEEWAQSLQAREQMLAHAAEIRLEEPAVLLRIAEAQEQATLAERVRVVELVEQQLEWFSSESPTATILQTLKKNVIFPTDRTLDRIH